MCCKAVINRRLHCRNGAVLRGAAFDTKWPRPLFPLGGVFHLIIAMKGRRQRGGLINLGLRRKIPRLWRVEGARQCTARGIRWSETSYRRDERRAEVGMFQLSQPMD